MKSITIHNMEPDLDSAIRQIAQRTGLSQNRVVKKLLRKALGLDAEAVPRRDFTAFCGLWSQEETEAFDKAIRAFEQIDEDLWK